MAKLRVYHLARELNLDNSEVIRELQHMGVPVTSHSNTVEDRLADQLRKRLGPAAQEVAAPAGKETKEAKVEIVEAPPSPEPPTIEARPEPQPQVGTPTEPIVAEPLETRVEPKQPPPDTRP